MKAGRRPKFLPPDSRLDSQGDRIRRLLDEKEILHRDAAHQCGITEWTMSRYSYDQRTPPKEFLEALAKILKVPYHKLKIPDRSFPKVHDMLFDNHAIEEFFEAPLDDQARKWIRKNLTNICSWIHDHRKQLEKTRENDIREQETKSKQVEATKFYRQEARQYAEQLLSRTTSDQYGE